MSARRWAMAPVITALAAIAALPASGRAQEDFRAADPDRPIRVEDAYPLKRYEWEWQLGARGEAAEAGAYALAQLLELKTGVARNWQLGLEAHASAERETGEWRGALEELGLHLFYNLNQEGRRTPAFALRADLFAPGVGDLARDRLGARLRAILTRSSGRLRMHVNGAYEWAHAFDGGDVWSGGVAFDYPIGLFSRAILADVYAEIPVESGIARVWIEVGTRWQLTNVQVLDFGLTTRADLWSEGTPNLGLVVGLSRVFGIAGLMPLPRYPNPKID